MSLLMDVMRKLGGHPSEIEIIEFAVDGVEDPAQREKIARHLASCKMCQAVLAAAMVIHDSLAANLPSEKPPAGLAERVIASAKEAPQRPG